MTTTRVIDLHDAAKALGRELTKPVEEEEYLDLLGRPAGEFCFSDEDFTADSDGLPLFLSPQKLENAKNVFLRWGVDLDNYCGSAIEPLAVWCALTGKSDLERKMVFHHNLPAKSEAQHAYLRAVHEGDRKLAARLFPQSLTATYVQHEITLDQLEEVVRNRPKRGDARENAVVSFI